ncbi:unnamed protein product [Phytophthora lilii]|uniref:Unnamed protein product n=1 Tax=Phytophthora lilii TaxID=2077276 RepID=A0A9W6TTW2_9STRA|nr:unnamed protein product [Phytophthora lilii]
MTALSHCGEVQNADHGSSNLLPPIIVNLSPFGCRKTSVCELLPNGDNVDGVKAIGHKEKDGGGVLNDFGDAFDTAGRSWSMELCMADSDGDGQTNGEELGDPCCEWTKESGDAPLWTSGVSNPGDDTSTSDTTKWPA